MEIMYPASRLCTAGQGCHQQQQYRNCKSFFPLPHSPLLRFIGLSILVAYFSQGFLYLIFVFCFCIGFSVFPPVFLCLYFFVFFSAHIIGCMSVRQVVPVPYVAKVCLHFGGIGPAGKGLGIRKPLCISKVKALKASIASRQHPVCRDL